MPTEELFGAYNFLIEIDGVTAGAFKNVEGLDSGAEPSQKKPGPLKWENIVMKKGIVNVQGSTGFAGYRQIVLHGFEPAQGPLRGWFEGSGVPQPKSGFILLKEAKGNVVRRWHFTNAWPSKVTGPRAGALILTAQSVRRT